MGILWHVNDPCSHTAYLSHDFPHHSTSPEIQFIQFDRTILPAPLPLDGSCRGLAPTRNPPVALPVAHAHPALRNRQVTEALHKVHWGPGSAVVTAGPAPRRIFASAGADPALVPQVLPLLQDAEVWESRWPRGLPWEVGGGGGGACAGGRGGGAGSRGHQGKGGTQHRG